MAIFVNGSQQEAMLPLMYRSNVTFNESWQDESGIDLTVWDMTDPATGTAWTRRASGAYLEAYTVLNANETARLVGAQRWVCAPDTYGSNLVLRKLCVEWEMKLTNPGNLDTSNTFFGLASANDDTQAEAGSYQILVSPNGASAYYFQVVDNGTPTSSLSLSATLSNWNKYRFEISAASSKLLINEAQTSVHVIGLPDRPMFLTFYGDTTAGGTATIEIGQVRIWTEDITRSDRGDQWIS